VDVSDDSARRAWLVNATGRRTVPQIFIDDAPVGGSDELHELDRRGALQALIGLPSKAG
jgi:glutaredoxin 3